jgi:hypothetical protein
MQAANIQPRQHLHVMLHTSEHWQLYCAWRHATLVQLHGVLPVLSAAVIALCYAAKAAKAQVKPEKLKGYLRPSLRMA